MKALLATLLLMSPVLSSAQFAKGDKFIGGTLNYRHQSRSNNNEGKNRIFMINPFMGFLLNEKFAVGGQIGFTHTVGYRSAYVEQLTGLSAGLISRRYFTISERFVFSLNGSVNYNRGIRKISTLTSETESQTAQFHAFVQPCFIFFPSPKWGFEANVGSIGYRYIESMSDGPQFSLFEVDLGQISFGLSYYFRKPADTGIGTE